MGCPLSIGWRSDTYLIIAQRLVALFSAEMRAGQMRELGCQGAHHTRLSCALPPPFAAPLG
jgi:hypothetical protein